MKKHDLPDDFDLERAQDDLLYFAEHVLHLRLQPENLEEVAKTSSVNHLSLWWAAYLADGADQELLSANRIEHERRLGIPEPTEDNSPFWPYI